MTVRERTRRLILLEPLPYPDRYGAEAVIVTPWPQVTGLTFVFQQIYVLKQECRQGIGQCHVLPDRRLGQEVTTGTRPRATAPHKDLAIPTSFPDINLVFP
jgi:hypothetical protein